MYIGVDIGGTDLKFGVINEQNELVDRLKLPTPKTLDGLVRNISVVCLEMIKNNAIEAVGVGSPGWVMDGIVHRAGNLPLEETPLAALLQQEIGLPVYLGNDAQCAGVAEARAGRGRGCRHMMMITLGTGVGGAIVVDGKLYQGAGNRAGEVGHTVLVPNGEPCPCGNAGCFERYASVSALIRQTQEAVEENPQSLLAQVAWKEGDITGRTVFAAMEQGCPVANEVFDRYLSYVAAGIDNVTILLRPDVVVLGGAISRQGDRMLVPLRRKLKWPVKVEKALLGSDAGMIGAAMLCQQDKE